MSDYVVKLKKNQTLYACSECGAVYDNEDGIENHLEKEHDINLREIYWNS